MLERYSRPGPRYTSYPTAPEWSDDFDPGEVRAAIADAGRAGSTRPLSLYLHLPFCQSLCLFCGCNVTISRDHSVAQPYLDRLHREIGWIAGETGRARPVEQIHLGGGTPTYLDCGQLETLFDAIHRQFAITPSAEISVEIEPRVTTADQCRVLRNAGVNRLSMGVQDFDPLVQSTIRRVQPFADRGDLLHRFPFAEYDFGLTLAQSPMVIEDRETQILGREVPQPCQSFLGSLLPGRDVGQQGL
jgi:oxygen-independent coproporphyrinogen-3 oxidase